MTDMLKNVVIASIEHSIHNRHYHVDSIAAFTAFVDTVNKRTVYGEYGNPILTGLTNQRCMTRTGEILQDRVVCSYSNARMVDGSLICDVTPVKNEHIDIGTLSDPSFYLRGYKEVIRGCNDEEPIDKLIKIVTFDLNNSEHDNETV